MLTAASENPAAAVSLVVMVALALLVVASLFWAPTQRIRWEDERPAGYVGKRRAAWVMPDLTAIRCLPIFVAWKGI